MRRPLVLFLLLTAYPVYAQTTIDPAQADADFAIQGEYVGSIYSPSRGSEPVGLQVVALGEGKFNAVRYSGGLPGAGWDRQGREAYSGERQADGAVLKAASASSPAMLEVVGSSVIARDGGGREIGRLWKVARSSPTMGLSAPAGAVVLFDGQSTEHLQGAKVTPEGLLLAGVLTKMPVDAFRLHLEFRTPYMPKARGQARGNSGVYIQQRYEVQILDSFGLEGVENECGGLYRQSRPDLNMCLPPLVWQTYDIWFTPPRFADDGKTKTANARITVLHNGVPIHFHREIAAKTGGGRPEGPQPLPINLQDHGNPVTFRNIWLVPGTGDGQLESARDLPPQLLASLGIAPPVTVCCQTRPCRRGLLRRLFGRR